MVSPGEKLHFPPGSVRICIRDIDRESRPSSDGYATIANTIWTWLQIGTPPDPVLSRFLFATARRLDIAYVLCAATLRTLKGPEEPFIKVRARIFESMGHAELMCIALNRAIDMCGRIPSEFSIPIREPDTVSIIRRSLREIRNAFEHIDDRAMGRVQGTRHPDALSIFSQQDFLANGVLRYAEHALDLRKQVIPALVDCRHVLFEAAVRTAGKAKTLNSPITLFDAASTQ